MYTLRSVIARAVEPVSSLLYPTYCYACENRVSIAQLVDNTCDHCREDVTPIGQVICWRCGLPVESLEVLTAGDSYTCGDCAARKKFFYRSARFLYFYHSPLREMIHLFKFDGMTNLGRRFGHALAEFAAKQPVFTDIEAVVPVPLHQKRRFERGYNQSEILAAAVASRLGVPLIKNGLKRVVDTPPQSNLAREERHRNIKGAFAPKSARIDHKRILLVDDVVTTGSTVRECATALRKGGASSVDILALALGG